MHGIFISYRREDGAGCAGRLYDRLAAHFGDDCVFMDVEGIEPGADLFEANERAVGSCDALIVIIGNEWLATDSAGHRRLGWDSVSVPAGTFKALRVELNSARQARTGTAIPEPQRVQYLIWYAPEAKRTIKHVGTVWAANGARLDQLTYELVKYRVQ
jgi:hypothetical protein